MYKIFLYTTVFTLSFFIIWVAVEPIQIKVLLGVIGLTFLVPQIRTRLYKTSFIIRKCKVAFYSSLVFTFLFFSIDIKAFIKDPYIDFTIVFLIFSFSALGYFIYGIPVSLLSDSITTKLKTSRFYASGLIHIGFGLLTYFIGLGLIFPTLCSVIFFLIDEFLRKRESIKRTDY